MVCLQLEVFYSSRNFVNNYAPTPLTHWASKFVFTV